MHVAGSSSWRFAESLDEMPHVALYVRDALGLEVPDGAGIPPALEGPLSDRRQALDAEERMEAALQWPSWWHAIVADEARMHQGRDEPDRGSRVRDSLARRQATTGDPPEFSALSDRPALRKAVSSTCIEARRWAAGPRRSSHRPVGGPSFAWALTKQIAEDVAFDMNVGVESVRGVALLLAVRGDWWECIAPGVVLCSRSAPRDPAAARAILRAVFVSGAAR